MLISEDDSANSNGPLPPLLVSEARDGNAAGRRNAGAAAGGNRTGRGDRGGRALAASARRVQAPASDGSGDMPQLLEPVDSGSRDDDMPLLLEAERRGAHAQRRPAARERPVSCRYA